MLFWQRPQSRHNRAANKCLPRLAAVSDLDRFSAMLNVSVYDDEGIRYKLPDHVHSEASSSW